MQSNETEREVFVWPDIFRAIGSGDDMVVSAEKLREWLDERNAMTPTNTTKARKGESMNPKDNDELLSELRWITSNQLEENEYKAILDLISTYVGREQQIGVQRLTKMDLELIVVALESYKAAPLGAHNVMALGYEQRLKQIKEKIEQDPKWVEAIQSQEEES